ncbi:hypothetical protein GCM10027298_22200 [Epidermidibacterium keratini]
MEREAMNIPRRIGDRYRCFVVVKPDRGWGGPYGQHRRPTIWRCVECGFEIPDHTDTFRGRVRRDSWSMARMADHHGCGHAPCAYCGKPLLRRKDGSPRQHAYDKCPAKSGGSRIEREFVKHISEREYA